MANLSEMAKEVLKNITSISKELGIDTTELEKTITERLSEDEDEDEKDYFKMLNKFFENLNRNDETPHYKVVLKEMYLGGGKSKQEYKFVYSDDTRDKLDTYIKENRIPHHEYFSWIGVEQVKFIVAGLKFIVQEQLKSIDGEGGLEIKKEFRGQEGALKKLYIDMYKDLVSSMIDKAMNELTIEGLLIHED